MSFLLVFRNIQLPEGIVEKGMKHYTFESRHIYMRFQVAIEELMIVHTQYVQLGTCIVPKTEVLDGSLMEMSRGFNCHQERYRFFFGS